MSSDPYMIAWLVPLFPLIGFLLNAGVFGFKLKAPTSGWLGTLCVFASFAVSLMLLQNVVGSPVGAKQHTAYLAHWLVVPGPHPLQINFELLIDPLSTLMMLIITGVGGLIHLYSVGYMAGEKDKEFTRFFTYLNLFVFFMLLLVMGNNFLLLFIGWEGVGLCSYLLIGYYFEKKSAGDAAKKAFIMNRIGDVGVLIGMFMIFQHFGTLDFIRGHAGIAGITDLANVQAVTGGMSAVVVTTMCLMLFLGATGKSAQIPLYPWLPDAMEGPTPVSALIHAATMVTAGIYMVSRAHTLFEQSDDAMFVVCIIGVATAIVAALIGLAQTDIKRVLAYSTVSQLGYMFAACGAGVFAAGMFHVMTHAFFKACLFLCSGSVIHAVEHGMHAKTAPAATDDHAESADHAVHTEASHAEPGGPDPHDPQDMRNMGGLFKKVPVTAYTMLAATLAICGIIPFAGYWSKDEILWRLFNDHYRTANLPTHINGLVFGVGTVTAFITAFYMFRMYMKTFTGKPRTDAAEHAHELPWVMTLPLVILAVLSTITGWAFMTFDKFQDFLAPSVVTPGYAPSIADPGKEHPIAWVIMAVIIIVIYGCYTVYSKAKDGELLSPEVRADHTVFSPGWFYWVLLNKYFVDEFNNWLWVKQGKRFANWLWHEWDDNLVDGLVNGVGQATSWLGARLRRLQTGFVRSYAFAMVVGILFVVIACIMGR